MKTAILGTALCLTMFALAGCNQTMPEADSDEDLRDHSASVAEFEADPDLLQSVLAACRASTPHQAEENRKHSGCQNAMKAHRNQSRELRNEAIKAQNARDAAGR